jgi:Flp pilus assembly protein TadD
MHAAELYEQAKAYRRDGDALRALQTLERAAALEPENPRVLSELAVLVAIERGQIRRGLELSQVALEHDAKDPETYLNLAQIYLKAGNKTEAVHCLREGLKIAPRHHGIIANLGALGIRRPPVFKSLPRSHPLNHLTGLVLHRLRLR